MDTRTRTDKLRAMADQTVSPREADIARKKLAAMGFPGALELPAKVAAMVIFAKLQQDVVGNPKWPVVEAKPHASHTDMWEVTLRRWAGTLAETTLWACVFTSGRGRFGTGMRFSIGSTDKVNSPREWRVWATI